MSLAVACCDRQQRNDVKEPADAPPRDYAQRQRIGAPHSIAGGASRIESLAESLRDRAADGDFKETVLEVITSENLDPEQVQELLYVLAPHIRDEWKILDLAELAQPGSAVRERLIQTAFGIVKGRDRNLNPTEMHRLLEIVADQDNKDLRVKLLKDLILAIDTSTNGQAVIKWIDENAFSDAERSRMAVGMAQSLESYSFYHENEYLPDQRFNRSLLERIESPSQKGEVLVRYTASIARAKTVTAGVEEYYRYDDAALPLVDLLLHSPHELSAKQRQDLRAAIREDDPTRGDALKLLDEVPQS